MQTNNVDWKIRKLRLAVDVSFWGQRGARKFDCDQNVISFLSLEGFRVKYFNNNCLSKYSDYIKKHTSKTFI